MPQNAYAHPDELPLDLQLDLLVDGELTESRRRELLRHIESQPAQWRALALRFLQHQTEKQSAGALMDGGSLIPAEMVALHMPRRPVIGRIGWYRISAVAAGLLIAVTSALVTLMLVRPSAGTPAKPSIVAVNEVQTTLPADVVSAPAGISVRVPLVPASDTRTIFPASVNDHPGTTTYIIQRDDKGGFVVIPVSTTKTPVY